MSEAVRLFLHRVVAEQALPFEVKVPNARTRAAMNEADEIVRSRRARFKTSDALIADIEKKAKSKFDSVVFTRAGTHSELFR